MGQQNHQKFNKHHKPSCRYQKDAWKKPGSQQEAKSVKENCANPGSDIKENLQQTKKRKVRVSV